MSSSPVYAADALIRFAEALFRAAGLNDEMAREVAEVLVEGDLLGHGTHGLALAASYLEEIEAGAMTMTADRMCSAIPVQRSFGMGACCPGHG